MGTQANRRALSWAPLGLSQLIPVRIDMIKAFVAFLLLSASKLAFAFGMPALTTITGLLLETAIHESGHALTASSLGWTIDDFRPYPNICGGRLVGGCVLTHTDLKPYDPDGQMNREYQAQSRAIAAAGSLSSQLGVLIFAPLAGKLNGTSFWGSALRKMVYFQNLDWIFYTVTDSLSNFQGDWYSVAKSVNVPTYYFVAPAAASYWGLNKYRQKFIKTDKEPASGSSLKVAPQLGFMGRSVPSFGLKLAMTF